MSASSFLSMALTDLKDHLVMAVPLVTASQLGLWSIYSRTKRNSIIDVGWVLNHCLVGFSVATTIFTNIKPVTSNTKNLITLILLSCWTARLGGYLLYDRVIKPHSDPRYDEIEKKSDPKWRTLKYLPMYLGQGFLTCLTSLPLYYALNNTATIGPAQIIGWALIAIGILGEWASDNQLKEFKKKGAKGEILRDGLWKKSRHPNLFFELLTWYGFAIVGIQSYRGFIGLLGPITLYLCMNFITIPATENSMKKSRKNWDEYVAQTNKFLIF